jgi:hypothetical protein
MALCRQLFPAACVHVTVDLRFAGPLSQFVTHLYCCCCCCWPNQATLDLSSNKYSAEAIWFAKWEGQPARLKFKWSEGSPNALLFDAAVAVK